MAGDFTVRSSSGSGTAKKALIIGGAAALAFGGAFFGIKSCAQSHVNEKKATYEKHIENKQFDKAYDVLYDLEDESVLDPITSKDPTRLRINLDDAVHDEWQRKHTALKIKVAHYETHSAAKPCDSLLTLQKEHHELNRLRWKLSYQKTDHTKVKALEKRMEYLSAACLLNDISQHGSRQRIRSLKALLGNHHLRNPFNQEEVDRLVKLVNTTSRTYLDSILVDFEMLEDQKITEYTIERYNNLTQEYEDWRMVDTELIGHVRTIASPHYSVRNRGTEIDGINTPFVVVEQNRVSQRIEKAKVAFNLKVLDHVNAELDRVGYTEKVQKYVAMSYTELDTLLESMDKKSAKEFEKSYHKKKKQLNKKMVTTVHNSLDQNVKSVLDDMDLSAKDADHNRTVADRKLMDQMKKTRSYVAFVKKHGADSKQIKRLEERIIHIPSERYFHEMDHVLDRVTKLKKEGNGTAMHGVLIDYTTVRAGLKKLPHDKKRLKAFEKRYADLEFHANHLAFNDFHGMVDSGMKKGDPAANITFDLETMREYYSNAKKQRPKSKAVKKMRRTLKRYNRELSAHVATVYIKEMKDYVSLHKATDVNALIDNKSAIDKKYRAVVKSLKPLRKVDCKLYYQKVRAVKKATAKVYAHFGDDARDLGNSHAITPHLNPIPDYFWAREFYRTAARWDRKYWKKARQMSGLLYHMGKK